MAGNKDTSVSLLVPLPFLALEGEEGAQALCPQLRADPRLTGTRLSREFTWSRFNVGGIRCFSLRSKVYLFLCPEPS